MKTEHVLIFPNDDGTFLHESIVYDKEWLKKEIHFHYDEYVEKFLNTSKIGDYIGRGPFLIFHSSKPYLDE